MAKRKIDVNVGINENTDISRIEWRGIFFRKEVIATWELLDDELGHTWYCSNCKRESVANTRYCAHCGARMK